MYCKKCGKKINESAQFCEFCGFNQDDDVKMLNDNKSKRNDPPISWYQLDKQYQKI